VGLELLGWEVLEVLLIVEEFLQRLEERQAAYPTSQSP